MLEFGHVLKSIEKWIWVVIVRAGPIIIGAYISIIEISLTKRKVLNMIYYRNYRLFYNIVYKKFYLYMKRRKNFNPK